MKTTPMKRITIVGDNAVEHEIVKVVHDLGRPPAPQWARGVEGTGAPSAPDDSAQSSADTAVRF